MAGIELNNISTKTDGGGNNYLGLGNATRIPGLLSIIAGAAMNASTQKRLNLNGEAQNVGAPGNYFLLDGNENNPEEVKPTAIIVISDPNATQVNFGGKITWANVKLNPRERTPFNVRFTAAQIASATFDKKKLVAVIKYLNGISGRPTIKKDDRILIEGKKGKFDSTSYTTPGTWKLSAFQKTKAIGGKAGGLPHKQTPSTEKQEKVTLRIMEVLLKHGGYNVTSQSEEQLITDFNYLCTGQESADNPKASQKIKSLVNGRPLMNDWKGLQPASGLRDGAAITLKGIPGASLTNKEGGDGALRSWYKHFLLQFTDLETIPVIKSAEGKYNFYTYDEFMGFISELVRAGPLGEDATGEPTSRWKGPEAVSLPRTGVWPHWPGGRISQKDSWNPADVWLVNDKRVTKWVREIKNADTINLVNDALIRAYDDKAIFGISLKKSSAKQGLHWEMINFSTKGKFKPMAKVTFESWNLNLAWQNNKEGFKVITNELKVKEKDPQTGSVNGKGAEMRIGSSQSGPHNINLEYKPTGGAAQLGKVPKDLLKALITQKRVNTQGEAGDIKIPTLQDAEDSIPDDPKDKTDRKYKAFKEKIDMILKSNSPITVPAGMLKNGRSYVFIDHICAAKASNGWDSNKDDIRKNVTMGIQILNWAWVLSTIKVDKGEKVFTNFIKSTYYYAQKKGKITDSARFGPFGKLS